MRFASAFASVLCLVCLSSAPAIAQDSQAPQLRRPRPRRPRPSFPPSTSSRRRPRPRPRPRRRRARRRRSRSPLPRRSRRPSRRCSRSKQRSPARAASTAAPCNMSPVPGSEIPIGKFPAGVGRASAADIASFNDASLPEVLQNTVPGVILGDAQGNVYQRNLQYRGFEASPVNGVAQGLAVYQNGVRINECFGDIVNWDFLPDNAIAGIYDSRRQSGLRPQRHWRRGRHRDARRLQLPGRRDRQPLRLVRPCPGLGRCGCAQRQLGRLRRRRSTSRTTASAISPKPRSSACTPTSASRATASSCI